jgi:membrane protease YdiL (CAAX protease family)
MSTIGTFILEAFIRVRVAPATCFACVGAQRVLRHQPLSDAIRAIGLGRPSGRAIYAAIGVGIALLSVIPAFAFATNAQLTMYSGWPLLLPGLFAQGGVAEEVLFRGFVFGNLRQNRSFWRAATLSAGPFMAAHLLLFATMDWPVALAATVLAFVTSFPLSRMFELGGRTIWAPAVVHFIMQSAPKVVEVSGSPTSYPLVWLAACALVSWLAFAFRVPTYSLPQGFSS